jgi:hypothetical protein
VGAWVVTRKQYPYQQLTFKNKPPFDAKATFPVAAIGLTSGSKTSTTQVLKV